MRPLRLTIEGLRSFRSTVDISFEGRDHLAIVGDTGTGKSSIIEAITYALFGRTTFSGKANQEIVNDLAMHMRVVLRFTVSGKAYEVTRVLRRAGDRTVGAAKAALTEFSADGSEVRKLEQVRQVDAEVEKILGLDAEAFLRTVVLPQGHFAQLLVDDDPARRAEILRQVWRADELVRAGQLAEEAVQELGPLVGRVTQELDGAPKDPATHLRELERRVEQLRAAARRDLATHQSAVEAKQRLSEAAKTAAAAEEAIAAIERFDFAPLTALAGELAQVANAIDADRAECAKKRESLNAEFSAIPSDDDGIDHQTIGAARLILDGLPALAEALERMAAEARKAAIDTETIAADIKVVEERLAALDDELGQHEVAHRGLADDRESAERDVVHARDLLRAARQFVADASQLQAQARTKNQERDSIEREVTRLESDALPEAQRRADAAKQVLSDVQRHNAAAHAAQGLHAGDTCSVCRRRLPDSWAPPVAGDLAAATEADAFASLQLTGLRDRRTHLSANAQSAREHVAERATQAEQRLGEARARLNTLAPLIGRNTLELNDIEATTTPVDAVSHDNELLAPLVATAEQCRLAFEEYNSETQTLKEQRAGAAAESRQFKEILDRVQSALAQRSKDVQTAARTLREALGSLPRDLPVRATLPDDPLAIKTVPMEGIESARSALAAREQELRQRAQRRDTVQRHLADLSNKLQRLNDRWDGEVATPTGELARALNQHRDVLAQGVARLDLRDIRLVPAVATVKPTDSTAALRALRADADAVTEQATAEAKTAQQAATEAHQVIDQLAATLGIAPVDPEALPDQVISVADERTRDTEIEARAAQLATESFAKQVEPLTRLRACEHELTTAHVALRDLAAALKPGAFPKWLTLRRSRALLVHASRLLGQMTGGRYAFAELTDESTDWRVVDNDSGLARTPASLSGGEKFLASLALALGMVEMMARSGGKLESLWLDEGFGALDSANLDAAIEALTFATTSGRMVAVISHVKAVAEQVSDVLAVTHEATGTKVEWLTAAQRTRLAEGDLGIEAADAVSGLLE